MIQIVCLGILVADIIGRPIDALPPRGALQLVPSISPHIGGCAANTGIGLQKLGVETLVVGQVGSDGFGEFVKSQLETNGVKSQVFVDEVQPTSSTMVLVAQDGERTFLHCTGANASFQNPGFDGSWKQAQILHIAGAGLMPQFDGAGCAQLLQEARKAGLKTSLDTAGAPDDLWRENLLECLPHLDYFVPSLHEVETLFIDETSPQRIAARLLDLGVKTVALKMGDAGSYVSNRAEEHFVAPFRVEAVDATGAGDAFAAGFLSGIINDFPLQKCAQIGNAAGALCVTQVGTINGYRSLADTLAFVDETLSL